MAQQQGFPEIAPIEVELGAVIKWVIFIPALVTEFIAGHKNVQRRKYLSKY